MIEQLKLFIKVRYTLIYVQTNEEFRFLKQMDVMLSELNFKSRIFNFAKDDPQKFLDSISNESQNTVFVLQDFHRFLTDNSAMGLKFIRTLRNFKEEFKNQNKIIIVTAPVVKLSDDIKDDFIVIESPLPKQDEIRNEIDGFLSRNNLGANLTDTLKERIVLSCLGLTIDQINKIMAKTLVKNKKLDQECLNQIVEEKKLIIGRNQVLDFYDARENMNNIGGLDNLKQWLRLRSKAYSKEAVEYGLPQPKGLLMLGVQGTGKSLTAKAVSSFWRLPLLRFDIGRVFGSLVGESENRIREAIRTAEAISPCILWIDEIDKAFAGMQGQSGDSGTSARVFGTFITWMQEKDKPVFIVATANDVSKLPAELLRKGRFDEIFFVDLPNRREREEIFKIHLSKVGRIPADYDLAELVSASEKYTGAEIEQVIKDAMYIAFADNERDFDKEDILRAISETVPLAETMKENITMLREWSQTRARKASFTEEEVSLTKQVKQDLDIVY